MAGVSREPVIECVVGGGAAVGENPLWSPGEGLLYWIDIEGRRIHRYEPSTGATTSMTTEGRPGSIALTTTPGRLVVATEAEVGMTTWPDGQVEGLVTVEQPGTGNRMNDGRATPHGSMVVGSMYESPAEERFTGELHVVMPGGGHRTIRRDIGVSNGQAFSADGSTYYFADSLRGIVWRYAWRTDPEGPVDEQVFFDFEGQLPGRPDGACVDADDCYWIACVGGGCIARITPDGRLDRVIDLPLEHPTMPAFGSPDLDVLYVTSLGGPGTEPDASTLGPGAVLAVDVGCTGLAEPVFAG